MFAISNDELENKPLISDSILCGMCGKRHPIKYGMETLPDGTKKECKTLAFYTCGNDTYLAGINGKRI